MMDKKVLTVMALSTVGGGAGFAAGAMLALVLARGDDGPGLATVALPTIGALVGSYFGIKWAL